MVSFITRRPTSVRGHFVSIDNAGHLLDPPYNTIYIDLLYDTIYVDLLYDTIYVPGCNVRHRQQILLLYTSGVP